MLTEVTKRARLQFTQGTDEGKRKEYVEQVGQFIQKVDCNLDPIDPQKLKSFCLKKRKGAVGADGWHADELAKLPDEAWNKLAICLGMVAPMFIERKKEEAIPPLKQGTLDILQL